MEKWRVYVRRPGWPECRQGRCQWRRTSSSIGIARLCNGSRSPHDARPADPHRPAREPHHRLPCVLATIPQGFTSIGLEKGLKVRRTEWALFLQMWLLLLSRGVKMQVRTPKMSDSQSFAPKFNKRPSFLDWVRATSTQSFFGS